MTKKKKKNEERERNNANHWIYYSNSRTVKTITNGPLFPHHPPRRPSFPSFRPPEPEKETPSPLFPTMRIRKHAKISPLLYTASSLNPAAVTQTHVCQLNQSPWDVITFPPQDPATLPPPPPFLVSLIPVSFSLYFLIFLCRKPTSETWTDPRWTVLFSLHFFAFFAFFVLRLVLLLGLGFPWKFV